MSSNENNGGISFSTEEAAQLDEIVRLYESVKAVILFGEEIAPENVTLPQILKELRDAFDHLMRVFAVKSGVREEDYNDKYVEQNLSKAFGHVYRSAYDALDWLSIILRNMIQMELDEYSPSAIRAAIPDYYSTIKPRIEGFMAHKIAQIRGAKDIGMPQPSSIQEYAELVIEIKGYWDKILNAKPGLIDYSKTEKKAKLKEYLIIILITAIITGLAVGLPWALT